MNSPAPRVILVGCGGIARAHLGAIGGDCVVALCDANLETARRLKSEFNLGAPLFDTIEAALKTRPDIAVIGTPPTTHCALVTRALEAGAQVLCEKPLATGRRRCAGVG